MGRRSRVACTTAAFVASALVLAAAVASLLGGGLAGVAGERRVVALGVGVVSGSSSGSNSTLPTPSNSPMSSTPDGEGEGEDEGEGEGEGEGKGKGKGEGEGEGEGKGEGEGEGEGKGEGDLDSTSNASALLDVSTYPDTGPGGSVPPGMSQPQLHAWHARRDAAAADPAPCTLREEMPHRKHEIPIFIMALNSSGEDAKVGQTTREIAQWLGTDAGALRHTHLVERTPGVNAYAWPRAVDVAEFAVASIEEILAAAPPQRRQQLASLYYIGALGEARAPALKGRLPAGFVGLGHHVGCLFGHMYQWQLSKTRGNKHTVIP